MRNPRHIDCLVFVVDAVDHAVVADANSLQVHRVMQLFAADWPRIIGKLTKLWQDVLDRFGGHKW